MSEPLPLGKLRRLVQLADHDGRLQLVDCRGGEALSARLAAALGEPPEVIGYAETVELLSLAASLLSGQASGLLLDPAAGLGHVLGQVDRGAAVVLAVDDPPGRLRADWSVAQAARVGAAAVSITLSLAAEPAADRLKLVQMLGDECAKHDLLCLVRVERPVMPAAGEPDPALALLQELAGDECQVDLLAVAPPRTLAASLTPAPAGDDASEPAGWRAEVRAMVAAAGRPLLLDLTGEPAETRVAAVETAGAEGVCGVLTPPDLWLDCVEHYPDLDRAQVNLLADGLHRLRQLVLASERCLPWFAADPAAATPMVAANAGADWHRRY